MKIWSVLLGILLALSPDQGNAQKRGNFEYYEATPEKFLNQRITIYIIRVETPAVNSKNKDDDYRIYQIYTSSQDGSDTSFAYAKVPFSKSEMFVKRYNQSQGQGLNSYTPRNATGVFRYGEKEDGILANDYYLDMMGE